MVNKTFDFGKQLSVGDNGEADFQKYYAHLVPQKSADRKADFILSDGTTIGLKTDTYDMNRTDNFFMEAISSITDGTIGGPWRAQADKVDFFVYYFRQNKTFFWFDSVKLCQKLDTVIAMDALRPREIKNKRWITSGFLVPRGRVSDVLMRQDTF